MRTRSSAAAADSKKTPPARKSAADSETPKTRRGKAKQPKTTQQSSVAGAEVEEVAAEVEVTPRVKSAGKRTGSAKSKTPASRRGTRRSSRLLEADEVGVEESTQKEEDVVESKGGETGNDEAVGDVRIEQSGVERPSGDGSGADEVTKDRIWSDVEESEKKEGGGMVLGVCTTAKADKEGTAREMGLALDVNVDEKEAMDMVVEVPLVENAEVSLKQQEEPDKNREAGMLTEVPLIKNAEVSLRQEEEPDKEEEAAMVAEVPLIANAEVSLKQQEEPCKKEETAMELELPSMTNAEVSLKQQEELDRAETEMEVPPIEISEVSLKQQDEPCKKDCTSVVIEVPSIKNAEVLLKHQEEPDKMEEAAMVTKVPPIANSEVLSEQQKEPCKKEETAIVMEVPPVTNAEVLLKQKEGAEKEGTEMELDIPPVLHADVSSKHEDPDKKGQTSMEMEESSVANADVSLKEGEASEDVCLKEGETLEGVLFSAKGEEPRSVEVGGEVKGTQIEGVMEINKNEPIAETVKSEIQSDPEENERQKFDDKMEEHGDRVNLEQHERDDPEEPVEETSSLEEENRELTDAVKERTMKKECEVFVGGLERDATEEDVRKVFERIGEVLEVRLHKNLSTNKNKGYAFVRFANKDLAKRALKEMKKPVICGKQCGIAPCEDNNTLFLGNICNTWTKEAIRQKLKEYSVEGVESINLVEDVQHEGLSRGFAFLEFSCHAEALLAYRRLQKADVVFGHPERTAKVAFAEPLREPDPEVMAQVKTVFLDGLPLQWDENLIREQLKDYGEILRVVLARNMSNSKRKDYGFVDFSTHDAAVACINGVNNTELGDATKKAKVKARLSNPQPKTQAVKGGICGGYLIGRGSGSVSKSGRNYGRGMPQFNRASVQRGRGFHQGGRGQLGRAGFPIANEYNNPHDTHGRQMLGRGGGRRGSYRGGYATSIGPSIATSARPSPVRPWHAAPEMGRGSHIPPPRQPYVPGGFGRPFGNNFDDPYLYDDNTRRMKRPLYMNEIRPDYLEPRSIRPRMEYSDPAAPPYGNRYPDSAGPSGNFYPRNHNGSNYSGGPDGGAPRGRYPSYYGEPRPYNGGFY